MATALENLRGFLSDERESSALDFGISDAA
jgi:hypothetical protein